MTLDEEQCTFFIISHSILLGIRKFSNKFVEQIGTNFMSKSFFFRKLCRLWDKVDKYEGWNF